MMSPHKDDQLYNSKIGNFPSPSKNAESKIDHNINNSERNTDNTHSDEEQINCKEDSSVEIIQDSNVQKKGISFKEPTPNKLVSIQKRLKAEEAMKVRINKIQKDVLINENQQVKI